MGRNQLDVVETQPRTLALRGELCLASVELLTEALRRIEGPVSLDLSELGFMDSTGLRLLLRRLAVAPVVLLNVPHHVEQLLTLSGVDRHEGLEVRRPTEA
jgi:anti-anti-sigma factor